MGEGHVFTRYKKEEGHEIFQKKDETFPNPTPQLKTYLPL